MKKICCPVCNSSHVNLVEKNSVDWIAFLYQLFLQIDVAPYFKDIGTLSLYRCGDCRLGFFSPHVSAQQELYQQLQKKDWYYPAIKEEYHYAAGYIEAGAKVLDIGCGPGYFKSYLEDAYYQGLDYSHSGKEILSEDVHEHIDRHPSYYDALVLFQFVEHLEQPKDFLARALSGLKKGGRLIVGVPYEDSYLQDFPLFPLNIPPHHLSLWNEEALKRLGEELSLTLISLHQPNLEIWEKPLFWLIFFLKKMGVLKKKRRLLLGFCTPIAYILSLLATKCNWPVPVQKGATMIAVYQLDR
ncbi:class I SAM-dependent methyltransferase [Agarilytica rhodophyticola]|uniref:class I SAM-dependent methyltransferase n=1 Tax=Agarilytica rhodophyticola TaxID=1737490 RepID=UPI000B347033|nr:class I SAM-dependent methyltransferase [Agarilytica rhodophyticola]